MHWLAYFYANRRKDTEAYKSRFQILVTSRVCFSLQIGISGRVWQLDLLIIDGLIHWFVMESHRQLRLVSMILSASWVSGHSFSVNGRRHSGKWKVVKKFMKVKWKFLLITIEKSPRWWLSMQQPGETVVQAQDIYHIVYVAVRSSSFNLHCSRRTSM
jgi:hypothetical protein